MISKRLFFYPVLITALISYSGINFADTGDYGVLQFLNNLTNPPYPNNPVDDDLISTFTLENGEEIINFDSLSNPDDHNDGFKNNKYGEWQTIMMDGDSTGAKCADGSDYKFKVKRSARSSNMVVFLEGGGVCWSYETCSVSDGGFTNAGLVGGSEGSANPDVATTLATQMSLATTAIRPGYHPKFKHWTKVYLPYCTQDLGLGKIKKLYAEENGEGEKEVYHYGLNVQASVINWLKENLEQPGQLLLTGQSAGGIGSEALYHVYRTALEPRKGYMLNDAGPFMVAPQDKDKNKYPSKELHKAIIESIELVSIFTWMEEESIHTGSAFDRNDLSTISSFIASRWPDDRFSLVSAQKDNIISGFSYNLFFKQISNEKRLWKRDEIRDTYRGKDMNRKRNQLSKIDNYGFFLPGYRPALGGHVLTIPYIESSTTNESDSNNVFDAIANLMNDSGRVMESWEDKNSLKEDKRGRYNDCLNYYYQLGGRDKKGGDVYLHGVDYPVDMYAGSQFLGDLITGNTCLQENFSAPVLGSVDDLLGIGIINTIAPEEVGLKPVLLNQSMNNFMTGINPVRKIVPITRKVKSGLNNTLKKLKLRR